MLPHTKLHKLQPIFEHGGFWIIPLDLLQASSISLQYDFVNTI